jgi:hypothetical protein
MPEKWDTGILGIEKYHDSSDKPITDRKNINRGLKKLGFREDYFLLVKEK